MTIYIYIFKGFVRIVENGNTGFNIEHTVRHLLCYRCKGKHEITFKWESCNVSQAGWWEG